MHVVSPDHRISRGTLATLVVTAALGVLSIGVLQADKASADPHPRVTRRPVRSVSGRLERPSSGLSPPGCRRSRSPWRAARAGRPPRAASAEPAGRWWLRCRCSRARLSRSFKARLRFPAATSAAGAPRAAQGEPDKPVGGVVGDRSCSRPIRLQRCCSRWAGAGAPAATPARSPVPAGAAAQARMRPVPSPLPWSASGAPRSPVAGAEPATRAPPANGSAGGGPAMAPSNPGDGGSGGTSTFPGPGSTGGGGGGGYFGGGGGGVQDPLGVFSGAGGGGSGFNDPSTTVVSTSTNSGDGSVTITYPVPAATTTTSGVFPRRRHRCSDPQQLRRVLTGRLPGPDQLQ